MQTTKPTKNYCNSTYVSIIVGSLAPPFKIKNESKYKNCFAINII